MNPQQPPDAVPALEDINQHGDPLTEDVFRWVVAVATRAPSVHNTQPWHFVATASGGLDVLAERTRQLPVVDPDGRQLHISAGAALHHAVLALHGIGREAHVRLLPDPSNPELLAQISVEQAGLLPDPEEWALLHATRDRHTHRFRFADRRLSKLLLVDLASAAEQQGARIRYVEQVGERRMLSDLLAEATHRLETDPAYRHELLAWVDRNDDAPDGIPASALAPLVTGDEFGQRSFGPSRHLWTSEPDAEHPDILLLWTPTDSRDAWLRTGAALSALLLTATCAGVSASMLNQPLEIPALRARFRQEMRLAGHPQMLLRMGYTTRSTPTRRRPLSGVLTRPRTVAG